MRRRESLVLGVLLPSLGCGAPSRTRRPPRPQVAQLEGLLTREDLARDPRLAANLAADVTTIARLEEVPAGATIEVFFGAWCGDSLREVPRFLGILDRMAAVPFAVAFIGVDRAKRAMESGVDLAQAAHIRYVPTFIVRRDGREVGRVVEHPTRSLEEDLLDLLNGARTGTLSLTRA